ncbi:hypothetical protein [Neptunomonas sp. XY-337]|uniref:hypothetical protein n=1 Tax=Neptunomonas sp. XY-337 TaxID=2561897 RepID=UPI0010AA49BC|nr:hypothetical protein [Neptunomonas sp. XY-337]
MRFLQSLIILCLLSRTAVALDAPANLIPTGLTPGDEFFVVFTTSTTDYFCGGPLGGVEVPVSAIENHATSAAAAGSLTSSINGWQALYIHESSSALGVITDTVAASGSAFNNNIVAPIYNTQRNLVANNRSDLFSGGAVPLANPMLYDENGNVLLSSQFAFTGFDAFGQRVVGFTLGFAGTGCAVGDLGEIDQNWANTGNSNLARHLYVLSPLLTVPSPAAAAIPTVPFGFLVGGGIVIAGIARRKLKDSA